MDHSKQPAWHALQHHYETTRTVTLQDLFAQDSDRFSKLSFELDGLLVDFSKTHITQDTIALFARLGKACDLPGWQRKMVAGEAINTSENRSVQHIDLRKPKTLPDIEDALIQMRDFSTKIRGGHLRGFSGKPITTIIHIGIGGSDLGPRLVCDALRSEKSTIHVRFVANADPSDLQDALIGASPDQTMVVVASKTFTTQETMMNAQLARSWLMQGGVAEKDLHLHVAGISSNVRKMKEFGIAEEFMFPFGDYVGGRFSLWSSIGLSICITAGFEAFQDLLRGAHAMDTHFFTADLEHNIPFLLGMVGIWHRNFRDMRSLALLPYIQRLEKFPAYVQQLDMESNGKSVNRDGSPLAFQTAPVIFGAAGTNFQHSFGQFLHQGSDTIPCEFIGLAQSDHHTMLANMLAQARALAFGGAEGFNGNRPSITMIMPKLSPYYVGMVLALYEHKIFTQGIVWGVNSFDQPGVELGKKLAKGLQPLLAGTGADPALDQSTAGLIDFIRKRC